MRTTRPIALLVTLALAGCSSGEPSDPPPTGGPLEPPPPGAGVQYRMTSTLDPGQEIERCRLVVAPPEGLFIQRDEVQFTPGSHHVVLYKTSYTSIPAVTRRGVPVNAAEVHDCKDSAPGDWDVTGIIAGSQSLAGDTFIGTLPEGVALRVEPGTVLVMNTHYLNASGEPIEADARINLYTIPPEEVQVEAGVLFHYNNFIRIPANGAASARMRCPVDHDIAITRVQSHMHRRGVGFAAHVVRGEDGSMEEIYATDRWEQVPAGDFAPPLQVKAGDALDFRCDYLNPEAREVVQGLTTRDEMCMLIGPYYPRDPLFEICVNDAGFPAESWIGSGAASCAETLGCLAEARPYAEDQGASFFGCVVDSCPGASAEVSEAVRCQTTDGYGACAEACGGGGDCGACLATACAAAVSACQAAACD